MWGPEPPGGDHPAARRLQGGEDYGWPDVQAAFWHPMTGDPAESGCALIGVLPAAQYPHDLGWPGGPENTEGGCSVQGFGVANDGGMQGVHLAGDWRSGRVFGLGRDGESWQLREMMQTGLQFTAGGLDKDGFVLAVNGNNVYLADEGPDANPPGQPWRTMPADEVPEGATVARTMGRPNRHIEGPAHDPSALRRARRARRRGRRGRGHHLPQRARQPADRVRLHARPRDHPRRGAVPRDRREPLCGPRGGDRGGPQALQAVLPGLPPAGRDRPHRAGPDRRAVEMPAHRHGCRALRDRLCGGTGRCRPSAGA
jgi:hypothetical protein